MFVSNVLSGITIGLPVMATVGPISLLLLNQGKNHGARRALPAALGVASADLTYSTLAAVAGSALVAALAPMALWLRVFGVAVVVVLAWQLARTSKAELAELKRHEADIKGNSDLLGVVSEPELVAAAAAAPGGVDDSPATLLIDPDPLESTVGQLFENTTVAEAGGQRWHRLAISFYGLTLMNPMSIVLLSAIVISGSRGVGTAGWAVGMAIASLIAHCGFVILGSVLRRAFSPIGLARMSFFSAGAMMLVAAHLVIS